MDAEDLLLLFDQWQDEVRREAERQARYSQALNSVVVVGALVAGVQGQLLGETLNLTPWTLRAQACNSIAFLGLVAEVAGTFFGAVNAVKLQRKAQRGTGALDRMDQCKGNLKILVKYVAANMKPPPTAEGPRVNTKPFAPRPEKPMRGLSYADPETRGPPSSGSNESDPDVLSRPTRARPQPDEYPPVLQTRNPYRRQTTAPLQPPQDSAASPVGSDPDPITDGSNDHEDIAAPGVPSKPSPHRAAADQEEDAFAATLYNRQSSGTPDSLDVNKEESNATPVSVSSNNSQPSGLEGSHPQYDTDVRASNYLPRPPSRDDDNPGPAHDHNPFRQPRWTHRQPTEPQASVVYYNGVTFIDVGPHAMYTSLQNSHNNYSSVYTYGDTSNDKGDHWIDICDKIKEGLKDIELLFGHEGSKSLIAGIDGIIEQVHEFQREEDGFRAIAARSGTEDGLKSGQQLKHIRLAVGKKPVSPLEEISLEIVSLVSMGFGVVCLAVSIILFAAARTDILGNQIWALCVALLLAVTLVSVLPFVPLRSMGKLMRGKPTGSAV